MRNKNGKKSILEQFRKIIVLMYVDIKFVERCHIGVYPLTLK